MSLSLGFVLIEVGLTQNQVDHELLFMACHVGLHVLGFSSIQTSVVPWAIKLKCKVKWDGLGILHEILDFNGHEPSSPRVKVPLRIGYR